MCYVKLKQQQPIHPVCQVAEYVLFPVSLEYSTQNFLIRNNMEFCAAHVILEMFGRPHYRQ